MQDAIQDEADYWYVRYIPDSTQKESLLQFYKSDYRTSEDDWKTEGHFFIITNVSPFRVKFKLGDYNTAMKNGNRSIIRVYT